MVIRKKQKIDEMLISVFYHFKERIRFLYKATNCSKAERILEGVL